MEPPVIQLENLVKTFGEGENIVVAVDRLSLTIQRGEFVAFMGPSGSGKSTLMNILGCLDRPTTGSYFLSGANVARLTDAQQARVRLHEIGFVFQGFNLLPRLTALENVELPLTYAGVRGAERKRRAAVALEAVGLGVRMEHVPAQLSGGQQQRVAIARALVNHPSLLLADEPTGALDTRTSQEVMEIFSNLHREGITVVLVTHEPDIAVYTERVLSFRDGRLTSDTRKQQAAAAGD